MISFDRRVVKRYIGLRYIPILLLLLGFLASSAHAQPMFRAKQTVIQDFFPYSSGSGKWNGGSEDSLVQNVVTHTGWIDISGARRVTVMFSDMANAAFFVDSLGAASLQLSDNDINYIPINLNTFSFVSNDTTTTYAQGKWLGLSLSGEAGTNFSGYLKAYVTSDHNVTKFQVDALPYNRLRLAVQPSNRPRCVSCSPTVGASVGGVTMKYEILY